LCGVNIQIVNTEVGVSLWAKIHGKHPPPFFRVENYGCSLHTNAIVVYHYILTRVYVVYIVCIYTVHELNNFLIIKFIIEGYLFYRIHIILDPTLREKKTRKQKNIQTLLMDYLNKL
jgi:hypothetical protein